MAIKTSVQFIKKFDVSKEVAERMDDDIAAIAALTETAVKERTPVKTGRLRSSITAVKRGFAEFEVTTKVKYAEFIEYGTTRMSARAMFRRGAAWVAAKGLSVLKKSGRIK